ncbi:MAG TPA: hypothetical protein VGR21_04205 [Cryptosporangiaceae bacterium]|nr:hypothetical protein [Cryptosporangiaceae bacterium]
MNAPRKPAARPSRLAVAVAAAFAALVLAGCSSEGASTSCGLDSCTVTLDRSVGAKASVLGVEAKLVKVENDQAVVEVGGQQATLDVGGQTDVGGFQVTLKEVTDQNVVLVIRQA